jgi:hypothetical protein
MSSEKPKKVMRFDPDKVVVRYGGKEYHGIEGGKQFLADIQASETIPGEQPDNQGERDAHHD